MHEAKNALRHYDPSLSQKFALHSHYSPNFPAGSDPYYEGYNIDGINKKKDAAAVKFCKELRLDPLLLAQYRPTHCISHNINIGALAKHFTGEEIIKPPKSLMLLCYAIVEAFDRLKRAKGRMTLMDMATAVDFATDVDTRTWSELAPGVTATPHDYSFMKLGKQVVVAPELGNSTPHPFAVLTVGRIQRFLSIIFSVVESSGPDDHSSAIERIMWFCWKCSLIGTGQSAGMMIKHAYSCHNYTGPHGIKDFISYVDWKGFMKMTE